MAQIEPNIFFQSKIDSPDEWRAALRMRFLARTYLKISKIPEEDADGGELDEAEEGNRVVLPAHQ
jgi:hypothetical protein